MTTDNNTEEDKRKLQVEYALKQMIKLADMMECCEHGSKEYKALARDYRAYAKVAMPHAFKRKK